MNTRTGEPDWAESNRSPTAFCAQFCHKYRGESAEQNGSKASRLAAGVLTVNRTSRGLSAFEPTHHATATAIGAADLVATGDGEGIELIIGDIKKIAQATDATEIRRFSQMAALTACVVDAPAIGPNHG